MKFNSKIKTNVTFSNLKSENNVDNLKIDFKIPTLNTNNIVLKPPVLKPIFSSTINNDNIGKSFSNLPNLINITLPNINIQTPFKVLPKQQNNDFNENYDKDIPRSEIISLIDYYPLYNNNITTDAGNHFKYQLLYLNANKLIINSNLKKYFNQNKKDLTYKDELQLLINSLNNKQYSTINFELYSNDYFQRLLDIIDFSTNQILNFYSKFDSINKFFINSSDISDLLISNNIKVNKNSNINLIIGSSIFLLNQKLSILSKKINNIQNDNSNIIFDDTYNVLNKQNDYKNLKINESDFKLSIPYYNKDVNEKISLIFEFLIYESYKNLKNIFEINENFNIKNINFSEKNYSSGSLETLLTNYPSIDNDPIRFLFSNNEQETYVSNVFQKIISSNFDKKYINLLGNEIIVDNSQKNNKFNNPINVNYQNIFIQDGDNNPPQFKILIKKILNNLLKFDFNKFSQNLDKAILVLDDLIDYYQIQVKNCISIKQSNNLTIGDNNNDNKDKIKNIADALRFIHFEYDGKSWNNDLNVSKHYVPYGNSEENIQNFIGFLTYLFKRTSKTPGQFSRDYDQSFFKITQSNDYSNIKSISSNITSESQGYWLAFNELIRSINNPEDENSSLKNPFYQKFSNTYLDLLNCIGINSISYNDYSYNSNISIDENTLFIMFNTFVFLADLVKQHYSYNSITNWGIEFNGEFKSYKTTSNNCIGIAGLTDGNDVIFYKDLTKTFPETKVEYSPDPPTISYNSFWFLTTTDESHARPYQIFKGLSVEFIEKDILISYNTQKANWKESFNNIRRIYDYYVNNLQNINNILNELLTLDYNLLSTLIDQSFIFNKRNFFISRFQFNEIKNKFNKINKLLKENYIIDDLYNEKYEFILRKSLSSFNNKSKILTFGVPNEISISDEIIVSIYRKNLFYENLIFKNIEKTFNLNLFCSLVNLYDVVNMSNDLDLIKNTEFFKFNNDLKFEKLSQLNLSSIDLEILKNHFLSEILVQYMKIMSGIVINESTMIDNYPVIDSSAVFNNISNVINDTNQTLSSISNNITTFVSPLQLRSFLYSKSIFERVFSILINSDDFEIDTSNWNNLGWSNKNNLPFKIKEINGKLYLDEDSNIVDSYKIKIDKK